MSLAISDIAAVLKKVIIPRIQSQLRMESVLFNKIKKNMGVTQANNEIYISARVSRHSGIYTVAEGTQPKSGKATYAQPKAAMKYAFGTLEITDQAIEAAKKNDLKAIASILATEITALKDDFKMDLNRQFHGDGNGILCQPLASDLGNTTTLLLGSNPNGGDPTEYLAPGMYIQLNTGTAVEISSVDSATQVTLSAASTWDGHERVTKTSDAECMGLAGIIDDGTNVSTFQNLARASYPWLKCHVNSDVWGEDVGTLSEAHMTKIALKCRKYGGTNLILAGETAYRIYSALLTSIKRTANTKEILSGGFMGLEFAAGGGNAGVMLDADTWEGYMQFINFASMTIAEMSEPFAWLEADAHGGILKRNADDRTVWEGTLKYYLNFVGLKIQADGRLKGITS